MSHPRNSPCHCGSGKKYKKCCFIVETESRIAKMKQDREASYKRMLEHRARTDANFALIASLFGVGMAGESSINHAQRQSNFIP